MEGLGGNGEDRSRTLSDDRVRGTGGLEGDCCSEEAESDGGDGDRVLEEEDDGDGTEEVDEGESDGGDGDRVLEEGDKDSTEEADEGESDGGGNRKQSIRGRRLR